MLNIVHDHFDQVLPTVTPLCASAPDAADGTHVSEICKPLAEPGDHCKGLGHTVRELMNRSHGDRLSSHADKAEHDNEKRETSATTSGLLKARVARPCRGVLTMVDSKPTFEWYRGVMRHRQHADVPIETIMLSVAPRCEFNCR